MWVKKGQQLYDTHHREVCEILNLISLFCQSAWGLLCFEWIFSLRWLCSVRCGVVWACPCLHSPKLLSFLICLTHPFIFCNLPHTPFYLLQFANALDLIICFWTWCSSSLKSVIAAVPNKLIFIWVVWNTGHVVIGDKIAAETFIRWDGAKLQSETQAWEWESIFGVALHLLSR